MPKNIKKEQIKKEILADKLSVTAIANKYGVGQPYVSQLRIEAERDDLQAKLRFLYNLMNNKMTFKENPTIEEAREVKEVKTKI